MIDIEAITSNLTLNASGIWVASNEEAISYPSEGNQTCFEVEDNSFWFSHRNHVISSFVAEFSKAGAFFDIGGGNGCVSRALQDAGMDVVLIEPGPVGARNAHQRGVKTVIQATLDGAGFIPGTLDSAGIFDVLEHIETDEEFLRDIFSYLRPGGHLYVTVPAHNFLWSIDDDHAGHFRRYNVATLTNGLKEAGFKVDYCTHFFSILVAPIFLLRSIPSRIGLRKSVTVQSTQQEHTARGAAGAVIDRVLEWELARMKKHKRIPIGSSCIAVATKLQSHRR